MVREVCSGTSERLDEAQMEITHGLVKYKRFESEELLTEWLTTHPDWAKVNTKKGWYAGWSVVQKITQEAVIKTSRYYKLNVTLAIDPQYGDTWATCH